MRLGPFYGSFGPGSEACAFFFFGNAWFMILEFSIHLLQSTFGLV